MKRLLRWSAIVAALFSIAVVIAGAVINWNANTDIAARLDEIRRAGAPTAPKSAEPAACTPEENAAALLLGAFDGLDPALDAIRLDGSIPSTDLAAKIPDFVAKYADRLATARRALERPRCRFDVDYAAGVSAELRHIRPMLLGAKLMAADAFDRRAKDDMAGSVDAALDLLRLAVALGQEPILITQLVRTSVVVEAMGLIEGQPMTAAQEERLLAQLDLVDLRGGVVRALQADRAMIIQIYGELLAGHGTDLGLPGWMAWAPARPLVRREFADYLRVMNELVALAGREHHEARAAMMVQEGALRASRSASFLAPAVSRTSAVVATAQARMDLARLAVFVRRGAALPAKVDPFCGRPYGRRGDLLWSVGEDARDDGGSTATDLVWRVR